MSALAMILAKNGYSIWGSDNKKSPILKELAANKINIFQTQKEENIDKIVEQNNKNILIVISSAIRTNNLELQQAKKYNLKVQHRSEILKLLIMPTFSFLECVFQSCSAVFDILGHLGQLCASRQGRFSNSVKKEKACRKRLPFTIATLHPRCWNRLDN